MNDWQISAPLARWLSNSLTLALDWTKPAKGLALADASLLTGIEARLFGLALPDQAVRTGDASSPLVARGAALHVRYDAVEPFPVHTEVSWTVTPASRETAVTTVDAVVSVRTEHLHAQPRLVVRCEIPAVEILIPENFPLTPSTRWVPSGASLPSESMQQNSPCLLFHLPGGDLSYLRMVHPAEHQACELTFGDGAIVVEQPLFCMPLEKGVILRARLRGALLHRIEEAASAAASYRQFVEADPPLGW